jgi:hypothetical protein
MHPVEEDSRFAIQPVYPDRTVRPFVQKERSTKKKNLLLLDQVEKWRTVSGPAGVDYF